MMPPEPTTFEHLTAELAEMEDPWLIRFDRYAGLAVDTALRVVSLAETQDDKTTRALDRGTPLDEIPASARAQAMSELARIYADLADSAAGHVTPAQQALPDVENTGGDQ